jgi:hypothetical protein
MPEAYQVKAAMSPSAVSSRNTVIEQKVSASPPKADMPTAVLTALRLARDSSIQSAARPAQSKKGLAGG